MFDNNSRVDVAIIGAGIVGSMIARELSRYQLSVALLDRANDVGTGASCANSAILHSGHDPRPGSLKARLNRRGNELWWKIGEELDIPRIACGSMIVALGREQLPELDKLLARGTANNIEGLRILSADEARTREPLLSDATAGALWTPTAGVIDPLRGTVAIAESAAVNGVSVELDCEVSGLIIEGGRIAGVHSSRGDLGADWVINAAGIYSDVIMHEAGDHPEYSLIPRKGEYFLFDAARVQVHNVLFPLPTEKGKGTLVTVSAHGNTMIGPNATVIENRDDTSNTAAGMQEILASAQRLVPSLDARDIIASFAGIRATGVGGNGDFLIELSSSVDHLVHLSGIESPGYVAAPAIAEHVVGMLAGAGLRLAPKPHGLMDLPRRPRFRELSHEERAKLIAKDSSYGRIVCRCEMVTEGEVVAAMKGPIPARSYDALKRRCWLGTGRCQGGFDYSRVIELMARENGLPQTEVTKKGGGSRFLYRETKDAAGLPEPQCAGNALETAATGEPR